jgi:hypothetical protein
VGVTWELVGLAMGQVGGGEMEYDGRVAGIGASAGKEGDMHGAQRADRGVWKAGSLDVV